MKFKIKEGDIIKRQFVGTQGLIETKLSKVVEVYERKVAVEDRLMPISFDSIIEIYTPNENPEYFL